MRPIDTLLGRKLTPNERRYLARRRCGWCEIPLDENWCGAMFRPRCAEDTMRLRAEKCLADYKPRKKA